MVSSELSFSGGAMICDLCADMEVALKRNPYESDHAELTRKDKSARSARVDSYKSAEPHKI